MVVYEVSVCLACSSYIGVSYVYCYKALPLLDGEGLCRIDAEADGFALRVKGIEVDVCDYAEGRLRTVRFELVQLFVGKLRLRDAAWRGDGEL
jgi:hypothetical protein